MPLRHQQSSQSPSHKHTIQMTTLYNASNYSSNQVPSPLQSEPSRIEILELPSSQSLLGWALSQIIVRGQGTPEFFFPHISTWLEGEWSLLYWSIVSITELTFSVLLRAQKMIGYKPATSSAFKQKDQIQEGTQFWDLSIKLRNVQSLPSKIAGSMFYALKAIKMPLTQSFCFCDLFKGNNLKYLFRNGVSK